MAKLDLKASAVLVWMADGVTPSIGTFERQEHLDHPYPNPEAWWELGAALASSLRADTHGKVAWIKVGNELLSPDRVRKAYQQARNLEAIDA